MRKYLFIDQTIDQLKEESLGSKKHQFELLINQTNSYFNQELTKEHPPKSTTYMGMAIANLSFSFLLTNDIKYYNEAVRWIKTVIGYEKWGHAHLVNVDLSASWIMFGLSLSYDWIKDHMDLELKKQVEDKLNLQATIMYEYRQKTYGKGWSTNFFQNHNWINLTGLAAAAFALGDLNPNTSNWLKVCEDNFNEVYPYLPQDGSYYEGVVYWRYGAMWLHMYAHLIKTETGFDYFKKVPFLHQTIYYRIYQAVPNLMETANFGDTHDTGSASSTAFFYKIASEYNDGYAQELGHIVENEFLEIEAKAPVKPGIMAEVWLNYLWFNPSVERKDFKTLPLHKFFPDLGLLAVRSSWERDATFFTIKASPPGGKLQWKRLWELYDRKIDAFGLSHHHPDNLSFILNSKGKYLIIDDGYNRHMRAEYHSLPLIDNIGYPVEDVNDVLASSAKLIYKEDKEFKPSDFEANVTDFKYSENGIIYVAEAHKMYDRKLKMNKVRRTVFSTHNNYFIIKDQLESDIDHKYQTLFQLASKYEINKEGGFHIKNGDATLDIISLNDMSHELKSRTIKAVMTTQEPDIFRTEDLETLVLSTKEKSKQSVITNLLIVDKEENNIQVEKIDNDDLSGAIIKHKNGKDIFLISKRQIKFNNILTDAHCLLLSYQEDKLVHYIIHKGSYLSIDNKIILNKKNKANYLGGE